MGGLSATYHVNEIVSVEGAFSYSPDLGSADNRNITEELQTEYAATPVISKINQAGSLDLVFSPLYGKFAFLRRSIVNFDIYLAAGGGFSRTIDQSEYKCDGTRRDDALAGSQTDDDQLTPLELDALCETHFTTNYGFGFRGAFNEWMAIRVDG
ncbi:MAG: outer membrane beta-barrel domain-containing protein, partial [Myxococcales bacterium]|nr:outer membrane beta-barrel domain-containing protein [Myxococcales bacterium]